MATKFFRKLIQTKFLHYKSQDSKRYIVRSFVSSGKDAYSFRKSEIDEINEEFSSIFGESNAECVDNVEMSTTSNPEEPSIYGKEIEIYNQEAKKFRIANEKETQRPTSDRETEKEAALLKRPNSGKLMLILNGPCVMQKNVIRGTTISESMLFNICKEQGSNAGFKIEMYTSNHEGTIIDHLLVSEATVILLNTAGLLGSYPGIQQAINQIETPIILIDSKPSKNVYQPAVNKNILGYIDGFGIHSYTLAIDAASRFPNKMG